MAKKIEKNEKLENEEKIVAPEVTTVQANEENKMNENVELTASELPSHNHLVTTDDGLVEITATDTFIDKYTGEVYQKGTVIKVNKERAEEILAKGYAK